MKNIVQILSTILVSFTKEDPKTLVLHGSKNQQAIRSSNERIKFQIPASE